MVWKLFDLPTYFSAEPTTSTKVKYFVTGVVLPCICYLIISVSGTVGVEQPWQSGSPEVYATLLLSRSAVFIFLPLKIFAMAGLIRWLFFPILDPNFGCGLLFSAASFLVSRFSFLRSFTRANHPDCRRNNRDHAGHHCFFLREVLYEESSNLDRKIASADGNRGDHDRIDDSNQRAWIFFLIFAVPLSAPTLTCLTYMRVAVAIGSQAISIPSPVRLVLSIGGLIGAWLVSWRLALNVVMAEYQRLPTTNPNCYISSAAAYGHRHLVRSEVVFTAACESIYVNRQMRLLKFFELTLLCFMPRLQRTLRRIYDRIGPIIAQLCHRSKVVADIAFITLLPLQLVAELLRRFFHISNVDIERFWRSHDSLVDEKAKP